MSHLKFRFPFDDRSSSVLLMIKYTSLWVTLLKKKDWLYPFTGFLLNNGGSLFRGIHLIWKFGKCTEFSVIIILNHDTAFFSPILKMVNVVKILVFYLKVFRYLQVHVIYLDLKLKCDIVQRIFSYFVILCYFVLFFYQCCGKHLIKIHRL